MEEDMKKKRLLCWEKIQGNGIAFEFIIQKLLKVMFPLEKYQHTKETRDGGKDFVCITQNTDHYWAECKNYSANLALSDVAKTFVMAIAEDIKKVMIFSVSPFTEIALQEINQFTNKIQYELKIYDGYALDALMYQYINKIDISNEFKEDFLLTYTPLKDITAFSYVTRNDFIDELPERHFYVGDLITYNVFFKNNTPCTQKLKYTFDKEQIPAGLFLITPDEVFENASIVLEPGSYIQYSFKFRILNYQNTFKLFDICYKTDKSEELLDGKLIQCDWIAEVSLLGKSREYLELLKQDCIGNLEVSILNLYGHSGVGKSRLIKEIRNAYQDNNYKTIFLPVHETRDNGAVLIRKIISTIKKIPYIPGNSVKVNNKALVYQVLYNTNYNILKNLDIIVELIYETLDNQKQLILIIDDLQFADSLLVTFVKRILSSANNKIVLVTGFNKDYIYPGTNVQKLFNQIKSYSKPNQNLKLSDFDSTIAKQYIYNCLDKKLLVENRLSNTINMFIENVGTNPLILHQTILYLAQKHIFEKNGTFFYIKDIEKFHQIIRTLTPKLKSLLSRRHKALNENLSEKNYEFYLIITKILSVFHRLSTDTFRKMFGYKTENTISQLMSLGLIKYNDIGDIVFYHQKLESFYFYLHIDRYVILKISNIVNFLPTNFFHEKFILKEQANNITENDYMEALQHLNDVDYNNELRFLDALYRLRNSFQITDLWFLTITEHYYTVVQNHKGIKYKLKDYETTVKNLLISANEYKDFASLLWRITLTCVNAFIQLHKESQALELLVEFEKKIEYFICTNSDKKNIMSALFNRYGVIYNTFNNYPQAKYCYKKSLKLGLEIHDKYKIIEAYADYGYLFYDKSNSLWKTLYYWTKMFSFFKKQHLDQYEYLMPKCYYHKIYVFLLLKKYSWADKLLRKYKELYWTQTQGYYKIKILFMDILVQMLKVTNTQEADCEEICFLLNRVEDECISMGTVREYYKVFYLKALYYLYFEISIEDAYENLKITYNLLYDICGGSEYLLQRNSPILKQLNYLILKCESKSINLECSFFSDFEIQKFNKKMEHAFKNGGDKYELPLKSKNGLIIFPKL